MADLDKTMERLAVMMWNHDGEQLDTLRDCMELLGSQPQIVRCKDCKNNNQCSIQFKFANADNPGDWYCADGERG